MPLRYITNIYVPVSWKWKQVSLVTEEVYKYIILGIPVLSRYWYFQRVEVANATETIVLLKWTFSPESYHLLDSGWNPPNGHTAYGEGTFSLKYIIWQGEWKPLALMVVGSSISRPQFHFGIFSWLGNCKHNMWQASYLLFSRTRNRPYLPVSDGRGRW